MVVAGTASGVGKTTVATGLMAALRGRGQVVAAAKVGPDFIDPGYHALATGRPGRNLDPWMCGAEVIPSLAARAGDGADVLVIEGVMGLFDGVGSTTEASTAHVARLLGAPVVLVVDASALSASVAALVAGYAHHDPAVTVAGVILNRVGSDHHEALLREALATLGIPVLGALRRDDRLTWRDRHLGLVPVVEHAAEVGAALDRLSAAVADQVDLDQLCRLATTARTVPTPPLPAPAPVGRCRIAVAAGPAFSFGYPDNFELLEAAGAELVPFDPLRDPALPPGIGGLIAGGGFPEVYAQALASNRSLLADVRDRVGKGVVTWAECGGAVWLCRQLDGNLLCGILPAEGHMTPHLALGYRTATFQRDTPFGPPGTSVRGHEFHYSTLDPAGDALALYGSAGRNTGGWCSPNLLASYLHLHLAGAPWLASAMVASVLRFAPSSRAAPFGRSGE